MIITHEEVELSIDELKQLDVKKIHRIAQVAKSLDLNANVVLVENIDQQIADYLKDIQTGNGEDTSWEQNTLTSQN